MRTKEQIFEALSSIIENNLGVEKNEITLESHVENNLGADSLDKVELIVDAEKEFNIQIPDDKGEEVQTVGDIVDLIYSILQKQ